MHLSNQNYVGSGTLNMDVPVLNRLDKLAKQHGIAYGKDKNRKSIKLKAEDVMKADDDFNQN